MKNDTLDELAKRVMARPPKTITIGPPKQPRMTEPMPDPPGSPPRVTMHHWCPGSPLAT